MEMGKREAHLTVLVLHVRAAVWQDDRGAALVSFAALSGRLVGHLQHVHVLRLVVAQRERLQHRL